jgi:3-hydroxyisobutyrate dehydrogenase-like beta-hydroxyacid dehydrogenase
MKALAIGWIGCGKLGQPMAAHLIAAGHKLDVFDVVPAARDGMQSLGATVSNSISEVCRNKAVVFSSLPDDRALLEVACGPQGVLTHLPSGAVFVDTSTVSPASSAEVARQAAAHSQRYLRVAVSGNPVLAQAAQLTAFASGSRDDFTSIESLLASFCRKIFYVGAAEQARTLKLVINLMIAVSAGMLGEALALGEKGGLDWHQMLDVISESAVGSPMVRYKTPPLQGRDYSSTFSCEQMAKDLDLILAASAESGAPVPMAAYMRQVYQSLIARGSGAEDYIATVHHAEHAAGITESAATTSRG